VQALAQDLPWKLKESRVLEILQAVSICDDPLQAPHFCWLLFCHFLAKKFKHGVSLVFN